MVELLQLTARTVEGLSSQNAAVHADIVWSFCLQVLTFRQEPPAGISNVRPIEDAAIALLLAVTLKLTEITFKPLFLRLVDWAAQPPSSGKCTALRLSAHISNDTDLQSEHTFYAGLDFLKVHIIGIFKTHVKISKNCALKFTLVTVSLAQTCWNPQSMPSQTQTGERGLTICTG